MQATIVFRKIWDAIHELTPEGERRWRYIILEGSSRSSKTRSLLQAYYLYAFQNQRKRMSVWRDVAKDCRDTVGYDMQQAYPDMDNYEAVTYNITTSVYTFPTKSRIEVTGTDNPKKVHGYQGDVIWLNEPYDLSRDTFDQLDMRTADMVLMDWNPKQKHFIDDLKKDPRTIVIPSTFRDNPFCPREQKIKILGYQPVSRCDLVRSKTLTEEQAKAYDIAGNPNGYSEKQVKELIRCRNNEDKQTANAFNWDVYGLGVKAEKPNRIFHFTEIPDEEYKALNVTAYNASDWGIVDPWGILESKYYDGGLYFHERNYASENEIRANLTSTELAQMAGDAEGIVTWLFRKLQIDIRTQVVCDNNRPLKIKALRSAGYQAHTAIKSPDSILDGISLLQNIKVYYTKSSTNFAYEQDNYSWRVDRLGVLEEPEDLNNHLMDCARYIALHLRRIGIIRTL